MNLIPGMLIAFFMLTLKIGSNAMDSIPVQVKVRHEQKLSKIKSKGNYLLKICINDSVSIKLSQPEKW